jgi:hypothetical protein
MPPFDARILLITTLCSLGVVEPGTAHMVEVKVSDEEKARRDRMQARPSLSTILNLHDFEVLFLLSLRSQSFLNNTILIRQLQSK